MKKKQTAAASLAIALALLAGCGGQAASGSTAVPGSVSLNPKPVSSEAESSTEEENSPDPYSNTYRLEQMGVDVRAVLDEARREAVRTYDWSCVTWHPDDFDSFAEIAPRAALARNFDLDSYEMTLEQNGTVTFNVTPLYTGGYGFSEAKINVPLKQSRTPAEEHDLLLGSRVVYESLLDGELSCRVEGFSDYTDSAILQDGGFGFERVLCLLTKEGLVEYVNLPACENFAEGSGYYVSRGPIAGISDVSRLEPNAANGDVTAVTNSGERISLAPLLWNMFDTPPIPEEYQGTFSGTVLDPNTLEETRELYLELSGDGSCILTIVGDGLDGNYTGYAYYLGTSTTGAVYGFDLQSEETGEWKFLTALDYNPDAEWLYLTSMSPNTLFTANGTVHAMTALQRTYG